MTHRFTTELQAALEAARIAGDYIAREYELFTPIPDAPANISTDIDRGSQEIILQFLKSRFPGDAICAEENTPSMAGSPDSPRRWVVDPIDGTRGFAMKNGEFSVMVGFTFENRPVAGVVLEPVTGHCTWASLGEGCWTKQGNGDTRRCRVSNMATLAACRLIQSHTKPGRPSLPVKLIEPVQVIEMYSAGVKMARVAQGEAELYPNTYGQFSDWDICAGHILVTEAGGIVTGLKGETITYGGEGFKQNVGLLASNTLIHSAAVSRLSSSEPLEKPR